MRPKPFNGSFTKSFGGLDFIFPYIDDLFIASSSPEEHRDHLRQLFERLKQHNLAINVAKCEFGREALDFLGHSVSAEAIRPLPDRVEVIQNFKLPSTVRELKSFLAMINFYQRFVPNAIEAQIPLLAMTPGNKRNDRTPLTWSDETRHGQNIKPCRTGGVEGRSCHIYTDHKSIIFAFRQKLDKASNRQARQLDFIGQITTDIRHIQCRTK